jgi:methylase of polypeptide subunit release factors
MQHAMQTLLLGNKLFWSPIGDSPQKVLDLGTGTGIWAIDFADMYPSAEVARLILLSLNSTDHFPGHWN